MQNKQANTGNNVIPFDGDMQDPPENAQNLGKEAPSDRFDRLISDYYFAKSREQDMSSLDFAQDLDKSSEELAFEILTSPAVYPRQVLLKLNILENELTIEIESGVAPETRLLVLFAGLKGDLIRLIARADEF